MSNHKIQYLQVGVFNWSAVNKVIFFIAFIILVSWPATAISIDKINVGQINEIVWSYDGKKIYFASNNDIYYYSLDSKTKEDIRFHHLRTIQDISTNLDQTVMASVGWDGQLLIRKQDASNPIGVRYTIDIFKITNSVIVDQSGNFIATGNCQGEVTLYNKNGEEIWTKKHNNKCINCLASDKDGVYLLSGDDDGKITLYNSTDGRIIVNEKINGSGITAISVMPSNNELICSGKNGTIARLSFPQLKTLEEYKDHKKAVTAMDVTSDGRFLISGGNSGKIVIRDLVINEVAHEIDLPGQARLTALSISPDGRNLAWGTSNEELCIMSLFEVESYAAVNSAPCNLVTMVKYVDEETFFPVNAINGGENRGYLEVETANEGNGPAFGVELVLKCDNKNIKTPITNQQLGPMIAGDTRKVVFPIECPLDATSGIANFTVSTLEAEKRNAVDVIIPINVIRLEKPEFKLSGIEWNDGLTGLAQGNNNKMLENGETIELTLFIENTGSGPGKNVTAKINFQTQKGLTVINAKEELGNIAPGQIMPAKFVFKLERNFTSKELNYAFEVFDERDLPKLVQSGMTKAVKLNTPVLSLDINKPGIVSNGDNIRITMLPRNYGQIQATGVKLSAQVSPGINISGTSFDIGIIEANKSGVEQVINLEIPRTYSQNDMTIDFQMSQGLGFPGFDTTINISIKQRRPDLEIATSFLSGGNDIRQGGQKTIQIIVRNNGELEATNVALLLSVDRSKVSLSDTRIEIGRIPPMSASEPNHIIVNIPGGISERQMNLMLSVVQSDYPTIESIQPINIVKREAIVVNQPEVLNLKQPDQTIISENHNNTSQITLITVPPISDTIVYQNKFILQSFALYSPLGIASFEIMVNGVNHFDQNDRRAYYSLESTNYKNAMVSQIELPLKNGSNEIIIQARESISNKIISNKFYVTYVPASTKLAWMDDRGGEYFSDVDIDIDQLSRSTRSENRCAIIIGIENYVEAFDSKYSRHDAEVFAHYCEYLLGVKPKNIFSYYDTKASYFNLTQLFDDDSKLVKFLKEKKDEAEVFLYYSGHGVPNYNSDGNASESSSFLLPYDVAPTHSETQKGGLSVNNILNKLKSYNPKLLFVAFDACFMGKGRDGRMLAEQRPARIEQPLMLSNTGEISLYATQSNETAIPFDEKYHGLFTYFLLKGLRGSADLEGNKDNKITFKELRNYLSKYVPEYAELYNSKQTPVMSTGNDDLVLVVLDKK